MRVPRSIAAILLIGITIYYVFFTRFKEIPPQPRYPTRPPRSCDDDPVRLELLDLPYSNYFYSDCNAASQVVITSPLQGSDVGRITPRFLVAWPAGNSGIVAYFNPQNGVKGSLAIALVNSASGNRLEPVYQTSDSSEFPFVGVSGLVQFNSSASLGVSILGSIRQIRDNNLDSIFQDAIEYSDIDGKGVALSRLWLDKVTTATLSFTPTDDDASVTLSSRNVYFAPGTYRFDASFNYPQLEQLSPSETLNKAAQDLVPQMPDQAKSVSFLSYTDKLLAGGWRFLTYFGRDSMISMLLMQTILSTGKGGAFEAGISAVLERINRDDGTVAHEEGIGDFATWTNLQRNVHSSDPSYDYHMIDTDYFLPVLLVDYFFKTEDGKARADEFMATKATINPKNHGLTYHALALANAEKIMKATAAFAAPGGQIKENLIHLNNGQGTGEWRDSGSGLGGGRIPYNVNAAIVPAGLRAIAALSQAGFFPEHPSWAEEAKLAAQIWEDETLRFFEVKIEKDDAHGLLDDYVKSNGFDFPSQASHIDSTVSFYGLALDGSRGIKLVRVMNTDDSFRHFLLNTTNQEQLSAFLSQTADNILRPFPAGLSTDVGLLVANPAYGGDRFYSDTFPNTAYHGTVVWSWQLAMMAAGLGRQLGRCESEAVPDFCGDAKLHSRITAAYNRLWDIIEENQKILSSEVWSWRYENGRFNALALGELSSTESNVVQYWSLTFLAVRREKRFK
ncbi:glycogen debranching enzyme [Plectosphaerella plurivora]|uniref:Glycogen debranching enzyme n=1 Tax=Plectosphaerella plurivora TaxID=936078 RepID=A0A9P8VFV4_9PEZI|nr:glycogen debranching enzyme [Plectosphaerella plurivora]